MESKMTYSDSDEQELFLNDTVEGVDIAAATVTGDKSRANEDTFAVVVKDSSIWLGVFDGATSQKPIEALGKETGAHFASNFMKDNLPLTEGGSPKEVLLELNKKLLDKSLALGASFLDTHTLPATSGTILKIHKNSAEGTFAQAGDTFAIVYYTNGTSKVVTNDTNKKFDLRMFDLIKSIATEKGISNREARKDPSVIQALLEISAEKNNNPNGEGSGVINGDPNLEKYLQAESFPLENVANILLGSDGLPPQDWSIDNEENRQQLLSVIKSEGFEKLFELKHKSEDEDPDWNNVRYKHSDDATGILINF